MSPLKKQLKKYKMHVRARKNYLIWQKTELKSAIQQKMMAPSTLTALGLISFFSLAFYPKVVPLLGKLAKKRPFPYLWRFIWRIYLIKKLPLLKLLAQFKQPHRIKKYISRLISTP